MLIVGLPMYQLNYHLFCIFQPIKNSSINEFRDEIDAMFGIKTHKQSIGFIISPQNKVKIEVGFQPKDDSLKTSLIIIR